MQFPQKTRKRKEQVRGVEVGCGIAWQSRTQGSFFVQRQRRNIKK